MPTCAASATAPRLSSSAELASRRQPLRPAREEPRDEGAHVGGRARQSGRTRDPRRFVERGHRARVEAAGPAARGAGAPAARASASSRAAARPGSPSTAAWARASAPIRARSRASRARRSDERTQLGRLAVPGRDPRDDALRQLERRGRAGGDECRDSRVERRPDRGVETAGRGVLEGDEHVGPGDQGLAVGARLTEGRARPCADRCAAGRWPPRPARAPVRPGARAPRRAHGPVRPRPRAARAARAGGGPAATRGRGTCASGRPGRSAPTRACTSRVNAATARLASSAGSVSGRRSGSISPATPRSTSPATKTPVSPAARRAAARHPRRSPRPHVSTCTRR